MKHIRRSLVIAAIAVLLIGIVAAVFMFKGNEDESALSGVENGYVVIRGIPIDGLDIDVTKSSEAAEPVEFFGDTGSFDISFLNLQTVFGNYEIVFDIRPKDKEAVYFCGGMSRTFKQWPIGYCEKIEDDKVVSAKEVGYYERPHAHPGAPGPQMNGYRIDAENSEARILIPFSEPGTYRATLYIYEYDGGMELGQRYKVSFNVEIEPQKEDVELLDVYYTIRPTEPRILSSFGAALRNRNAEKIKLEQVEWYDAQTQTVLSGNEFTFYGETYNDEQLDTLYAMAYKEVGYLSAEMPKIGDTLTLTFRDEHDHVFVIHLSL